MRVNTLLIASLTGAVYALPVQTVPDVVQDLEGLTKLPVGRRQLGGLPRPLSGLTGAGLQEGPLDQVTDRIPGSVLSGLSKRVLGSATTILNDLRESDLTGLGKRQLEQVPDELGDLSLLGLKKRMLELGGITGDKLHGLDVLSSEKRQLEQITDRVEDLSLTGIVRRQVQALADTLHGLTGQDHTSPLDNLHEDTDLNPPTNVGEGLPVVGTATNDLPVTKHALVDTSELTDVEHLETAIDEAHNVHLPQLSKRQLKVVTDLLDTKTVKTIPILSKRQLNAVTDLLDTKTVETLPIVGRGMGMQCVKDASGQCASEEHKSTLHATNDPKLDVVKNVTDALVL